MTRERHAEPPSGGNSSSAGHDGPGEEPASGLDVELLWERVDHDHELLRDLLRIFEQEYPGLLEKLGKAIEECSEAEVYKFSHKLKGSILQFSATTAAAVAGRLEEMGRTQSLRGASELLAQLRQAIGDLVRTVHAMVSTEAST